MTASSNQSIIRALVQAHADWPLADEVTLVDQAQARTFSGRHSVRDFLLALYVDAFQDAQLEVCCIAAGESAAAVEYVLRGRHAGDFAGIPPTGRAVVLPMALVCQIAAGQVYRASLYYDAGTLLRQLGMAL